MTDTTSATHADAALIEAKPDPWLQQALKQAYEYGKADGLKQRHTEAEVQELFSRRSGWSGEFEELVRRILGVPSPWNSEFRKKKKEKTVVIGAGVPAPRELTQDEHQVLHDAIADSATVVHKGVPAP